MTTLADISLEHSTFRSYVQRDILRRNAFFNSGAVVTSPVVVPETGRTVQVPSWDGLAGAAEDLSDTTPLTPSVLDSSLQIAPILAKGKSWNYSDLVGANTQSDPAGEVATKLAGFWSGVYNTSALAASVGAAQGIDNAGSIVRDVSAETGGDELVSGANIVQTRGLFGEFQDLPMVLVVHSDVYTALNEQDLIDTERNSEGQLIRVYQEMPIVPAKNPNLVDGSNYRTMLVRQGGVLAGFGSNDLQFLEFDRDIQSGFNSFASRQRFVMHPAGSQFTGNPAGVSATDAELADSANWALGAQNEDEFGIRMLVHQI